MKTKLIDTINIDTLLVSGAIFNKIRTTQNQPFEWLNENLSLTLDKILYLERSGDKWISPLYQRLMKLKEDGKVSDELQIIADTLISKYSNKWNRIYDAMNQEYDPLENYNMEQEETPNIVKNRTKYESTKISTKNTSKTSNYGFNSALPVPTGEGEGESVVEGKGEDNVVNDNETETGTRAMTRSGNIGVTSSQQLLESELKLRDSYNFVNIILHDVDETMCLLIY